jgi:spore germination protein YaaH
MHLKKILSLLVGVLVNIIVLGQNENKYSAHYYHKLFYDQLGLETNEEYDLYNNYKLIPQEKADENCNLEKIIFGWHPYWSGSAYNNYRWKYLTDLSYFSYEVNPNNGEAIDTHNWLTADVIDVAKSNGIRVNLCVTLFQDHAVFFGNSTAQQRLISNLISLVKQRNAHGINIDFEAVPGSQASNFNNFLIELATQFHNEIPGSQVSIAMHAVDWSGIYNISRLKDHIDLFIIMGYDYYYRGSSTAGPTGQLYMMDDFNYTIARSIVYYLNEGIPKEKLVCGLPYYGWEWETSSSNVPTSATNTAVARTIKVVKDNNKGNYNDRQLNENSMCSYYNYYSGGKWNQLWIDEEESMKFKFDLVNQFDIAGIGIWALGYDDGYTEMWNLIKNSFTNCAVIPCSYLIYDTGGPVNTHYDRESYMFTIAPDSAAGVSLVFHDFELESGYDSLWIFDGPDDQSPLLASLSGTTFPDTVSTDGNMLTVKFYSDGATVSQGWIAEWICRGVKEFEKPFFNPNPARDYIIIDFEDVLRIYIYSINGILLKTYYNTNIADVSALKRGVYIIKVNVDNQFYNAKLVVE